MKTLSIVAKSRLYWHTIKYLKWQQVLGRVYFRVLPLGWGVTTAQLSLRARLQQWQPPIGKRKTLLEDGRFCFLNSKGQVKLGRPWLLETHSKLWCYNLHYFDDLSAADARKRSHLHRSLLLSWVTDNPLAASIAWDPYPTSLRIVNWIKWELAGNVLPDLCRQSLCQQASFLASRLEWHLLGNHLWTNAKALLFVGSYFNGKRAERWLVKGGKILLQQFAEQFLADGGHFERSPMYHAILLEDVLDILNLIHTYALDRGKQARHRLYAQLRECLQTKLPELLAWLAAMSHGDGEISFFNDAALGIAPRYEVLLQYAERLGRPYQQQQDSSGQLRCWHGAASGYITLQAKRMKAIIDVGKVGPQYLPGHAHADTLSFELSLGSQRLIVNTGTSTYAIGSLRSWQRSTAAHNTVVVNNQNSSQVWSSFRVARRALPFNLSISELHDLLQVECSHDGYYYLAGNPVHRRLWSMTDSSLKVTDTLLNKSYPAFTSYLFHPDVRVECLQQQCYRLSTQGQHHIELKVEKGKAELIARHYAPEFGRQVLSQALLIHMQNSVSELLIRW